MNLHLLSKAEVASQFHHRPNTPFVGINLQNWGPNSPIPNPTGLQNGQGCSISWGRFASLVLQSLYCLYLRYFDSKQTNLPADAILLASLWFHATQNTFLSLWERISCRILCLLTSQMNTSPPEVPATIQFKSAGAQDNEYIMVLQLGSVSTCGQQTITKCHFV